MSWTLIILLHAGMLSSKDSMALTRVEGFKTHSTCVAAGKETEVLGKGTTKDVKWVCVKVE